MREQLDLGYVFGGLAHVRPAPVPHRSRAARRVAARRRDRRSAVRHRHHQPARRPVRPAGDPCAGVRARHLPPRPRDRDLRPLEVVDYGDAYCPHGQTEVSHANIRARVHDIASRGIVPIILGGDHSITWPAATAVADVHGYGNVGIVHFDAHADTADIIDGNLASHGTPMRRLIESGAVPGDRFVQVGLRGYWPPAEVFAWMAEQKMVWHSMQEIWERGFKAVMDDAVERGARPRREALHLARRRLARPGVRARHRNARAGRAAHGRPAAHGAQAGARARRRRHGRRRGGARLRRQRPHRQRRPPHGVRGARRDGRTQAPEGRLSSSARRGRGWRRSS